MRTGGVRLTTFLLASLALLGGCSQDTSEPRIREYEPGSGGSLGQDDTKANTPYAFDDATLCLARRGSVTVENVAIVNPTGGMRLSTFAVRPARTGMQFNYISDPRQRLAAVGYPTRGPMIIDRTCPAADATQPVDRDHAVFLLGVELVKPTDATATGSGFVVTYRSGERRHKVYVPLGIVLCRGNNKLPECEKRLDLRPPDKR